MSAVTKEAIQALYVARILSQRGADALTRLIAGESVTTIIASQKPPAGTIAPAAASSAAGVKPVKVVPAGEPSKTVTFFGNLAYAVDDAKLAELLKGYKLAVPAKVSKRQDGRSLGFAIVTFENEAEQSKAIAAFNNTQFEGRVLNVAQSTRGPRPARTGLASTPASGPRTGYTGAPRQPRPPRQPATGEASKTTVFVANLPYIVDDAGLLQIFEGFQVKEAHIPRRRNGLSTGYGFVTLASEAEAERAIREVDKSVVEKREISVRPSFNRPAPAAGAAAPAASAAPK